MPKKRFTHLVFIGRFQPFHNGHHQVLKQALDLADKVIVICGSVFKPSNIRDPWNLTERIEMIRAVLTPEESTRVAIHGVTDQLYNDQQWAADIQNTVKKYSILRGETPRIGLIGYKKDHTSFYFKLFPQWELVEVDLIDNLNATDIRRSFFTGFNIEAWTLQVPNAVFRYLVRWSNNNQALYRQLVEELRFIDTYKAAWSTAPYAPTFLTTDAVVVQSGHILLVTRRAEPGRGLLALPGGFVNQTERLLDGAIRELHEETGLKVPVPVLKGSLKQTRVFDHPDRSLRGRTVTHAFLFHLNDTHDLPPVKGADDAEKAAWYPLSEVAPELMFEDHYDIIVNMTGQL